MRFGADRGKSGFVKPYSGSNCSPTSNPICRASIPELTLPVRVRWGNVSSQPSAASNMEG